MPFTSQYSGLPLAAGTTVADAIAVGYFASPASPGHEATDEHDCRAGIVGLLAASLAEAATNRDCAAPATPPPAEARTTTNTAAAERPRTDAIHARRAPTRFRT